MGYGVKLTPEMKGYLDWSRWKISNSWISGSVVITTGGFTNPSGNSEAGMMATYLRKKLEPYCSSIQIITEEEATTTNENLRNTKELMLKHDLVSTNLRVVIFCDKLRERKVKFLAKKLLPKESRLIVFGYEGFSHSLFEKKIWQPFKTMADILGYYLPVIEWMEVQIRKARRDKKAKIQELTKKI